MKSFAHIIYLQLVNITLKISLFFLMKVLKMKEVYHTYMNIHLKIYMLKKKVVFVQEKQYTILPAFTLEGFVVVDVFEESYD